MPLLTPTALLLALLALTLVLLGWSAIATARRARSLSAWARSGAMQFCHADRFLIGRRVFRQFPIPGAADISVRDIAYLRDGGNLHCIFTVRCTIGAVGRRRYLRRVCRGTDTSALELLNFAMLDAEPSPQAYSQARSALGL